MIELIFVIVIIGILAAVAIPKLAATRDDARISNIVANARTALGDMTSFYSSQGGIVWNDGNTTIKTVTNVSFKDECTNDTPSSNAISGNSFLLCDSLNGTACITFSVTADDVTVSTVSTGQICTAVSNDSAIKALSNKSIKLGGKTAIR